jgi:hypothetical protein
MHGIEKRVVYILQGDADPSHHYVGLTNDLRSRLEWHNSGPCGDRSRSALVASRLLGVPHRTSGEALRGPSQGWIGPRVRETPLRFVPTKEQRN